MGNRERSPDLPAVDDRLVMPECGYEIVGGKVFPVSPAHEPHAEIHATLAALLRAHVVAGYSVAVDMLTRPGPREDFAPDASVYPTARDPTTGGRQLEELAFEVVSTESLSHAGTKAASLVARGVRRVLAIDVDHERTLEWSRQTEAWQILAVDQAIADPLFVIPLPLGDLQEAAADAAVARALLAKRNDVLMAELAAAAAAGAACARAEAVLTVLAARGIRVEARERARILSEREGDVLAVWLQRVATCNDVLELLRNADG
jgi:Uma2 family endonuclease